MICQPFNSINSHTFSHINARCGSDHPRRAGAVEKQLKFILRFNSICIYSQAHAPSKATHLSMWRRTRWQALVSIATSWPRCCFTIAPYRSAGEFKLWVGAGAGTGAGAGAITSIRIGQFNVKCKTHGNEHRLTVQAFQFVLQHNSKKREKKIERAKFIDSQAAHPYLRADMQMCS